MRAPPSLFEVYMAKILAIIEALKGVVDLLKRAINFFEEYRNSKTDKKYADLKARRNEIIKQLEKAETDEEIKIIHRELRKLNNNKR